jgi:peptide-methionine (S)-S-oxide reductase
MSKSNIESIVLGGGCFWCLDASYRLINGVTEVVSGYAGGTTENPTYQQVCSETTGHAEVVKVSYDPKIISRDNILEIFWTIHDPTTLNRQGNDVGTSYRSIILYSDEEQKAAAEKSKQAVAKLWPNPIVTEIVPLNKFYPAEEEHQNYFSKNPAQAYCQVIINPKLAKLRAKFSERIKS